MNNKLFVMIDTPELACMNYTLYFGHTCDLVSKGKKVSRIIPHGYERFGDIPIDNKLVYFPRS
jgi:hypothetical protein